MGYQLHVSKKLLRPVRSRRWVSRLGVLAVVCAAVSGILFAIIPYDKGLLLALMPAIYPLPAPFIIPLFADLGDDAEYVSTTLSLGTVLAVVLFFFPRGVQPGISLGKGLRNRMAGAPKTEKGSSRI